MTFRNLLLSALKSVLVNRLRASLTMLGVVIGVASVIAMLALGNGARAVVDATFQFLGADLIQVAQKYSMQDGQYLPMGKKLTYDDGLDLIEAAPLVERLEMSTSKAVQVRYQRSSVEVGASGVTSNALENMVINENLQPFGWEEGKKLSGDDFLGEGRFFTSEEVKAGAPVCVLGQQTALDLFYGDDPIGQTIHIDRMRCLVIGVLTELESVDINKRNRSGSNQALLIPIRTMVQNLFDEEPSVNIFAHVYDPKKVTEAKEQIIEYLREKHMVELDEDGKFVDDFTLTSRNDILGQQQETAKTFSILLAAMASISLVVGGIGIMNVMLVSVTERTREIGVRMAVGARAANIILQFLIEAVLISSLGGLIGIVVGILSIPIAASLNQGVALLLPGSIPLAFGVALLTGVVFGLYPAVKASRLNPIDALRYE